MSNNYISNDYSMASLMRSVYPEDIQDFLYEKHLDAIRAQNRQDQRLIALQELSTRELVVITRDTVNYLGNYVTVDMTS